jgi:hypothetical protein
MGLRWVEMAGYISLYLVWGEACWDEICCTVGNYLEQSICMRYYPRAGRVGRELAVSVNVRIHILDDDS